MKFSALICTSREPGLLACFTGDLFNRGIIPDLLWSEKIGSGTLRIRIELECSPESMAVIQAYRKTYLKVQTLVVVP